ncbi:MAG: hypothetical protein R3F17_00725 [Planctomycetota bacterium]
MLVRLLLACPLLIALGNSCQVPPPTPEEVLRFGFRTPVQGLQSFLVALRADLPGEEYRCFSSGFKARNGISRLGYLEFRDHLLKEQPLLRWALSRAGRDREDYNFQGDLVRGPVEIEVAVHGRQLVARMVREGFYSLQGPPADPFEPAELWDDGNVRDPWALNYLVESNDKEWLLAQARHPGPNVRNLVSFEVGFEWKIDELFVREEAQAKP